MQPSPQLESSLSTFEPSPGVMRLWEILQFRIRMDYQWFVIAAKGALLPISCNEDTYDANLLVLPIERTEEFLSLLGQQ